MPFGDVESAQRPEGFRDSPLIPLSRDAVIDRLDLENTFGRIAPLQVDLGCGDGSFICALAERMPEKNFLGIERLLGRIRSAARKAATIGNLRLIRMEISYAVRYLLPARSVEAFYLLFPDPWPKRRHHRRRIVTSEFLRAIGQALTERGRLLIATDYVDYFQEIERIARADPGFTTVQPGAVDLPFTKFERQFRAKGAPIYWLELRKVSPVR